MRSNNNPTDTHINPAAFPVQVLHMPPVQNEAPTAAVVANPAVPQINPQRVTQRTWVFAKLSLLIRKFMLSNFVQSNARTFLIIGYMCLFLGFSGFIALNLYAMFRLADIREYESTLGADIVFLAGSLAILIRLFIALLQRETENPLPRILLGVFVILHTFSSLMLIGEIWEQSRVYSIIAIGLSALNIYIVIFAFIALFLLLTFALMVLEFVARALVCQLTYPCQGLYPDEPTAARPKRPESPIKITGTAYKAGVTPQAKCTICLSDFEENQLVTQLKCHETHIFHKECLEGWVKRSRHCPMCRNIIQCV